MSDSKERYFLGFDGMPWNEVAQEKFRETERSCGFLDATGGFGKGSIRGRVTVPINHDKFDWKDGLVELEPRKPVQSSVSIKPSYCCGLMFLSSSRYGNLVLLLTKARPEWQKGKLNGVGGKVEPGETSLDAMVREFQEETGLVTASLDWNPFLSVEYEEVKVDYFKTMFRSEVDHRYTRKHDLPELLKDTDEPAEWYYVNSLLYAEDEEAERMVPNLRWIMPLALDPAGIRLHSHSTWKEREEK